MNAAPTVGDFDMLLMEVRGQLHTVACQLNCEREFLKRITPPGFQAVVVNDDRRVKWIGFINPKTLQVRA